MSNIKGKKEQENTIEAILTDLNEGESAIILHEHPDHLNSFYLQIGDKTASNTWPVTRPELIALKDLLIKKLGND